MKDVKDLLPKEYGWTSAECLSAGYVELAKAKSFHAIEKTIDGLELFAYLMVCIKEQSPGKSIFWFSMQSDHQMEEWIRHLELEKIMESGLVGAALFQQLAEPYFEKSENPKVDSEKKAVFSSFLGDWASLVDFHTRDGYMAFGLMMIYALLYKKEEDHLKTWLSIFMYHTDQIFVDFYLLIGLELAVRLEKVEESKHLYQQIEDRFFATNGLMKPDMLFSRSLGPFVRLEIIGFLCFGSHVRTNIRRFVARAKGMEEAGRKVDWSKVFQAPMLLEEAIHLYGEEAISSRVPEMADWVEWIADWQHGDYQSVLELLGEMETHASNNAQSKSISTIKERLFYVRGSERDRPPDFGFDGNGINESGSDFQQGTEIELLKYYLGFERNIQTASWYESQLSGGMSTTKGANCFENYLDGEYGWVQGDVARGRRACHRVEESDWYFPWFLGRIYDFEGEWKQSIESYRMLVQNLGNVYPGHFLYGEVQGRLAWANFSLGQVDEGLLALDALATYIERYAAQNQMLLYKYNRLLAKAHFLTGCYDKALSLYKKLIGKRRWENRLDREGAWLFYEMVSVLLEIGHLSEAKDQIDRYLKNHSEWTNYRTILELKWAGLADEKQVYMKRKEVLLETGPIPSIQGFANGQGLKMWEQEELLAFVIETDIRMGILKEEELDLIYNRYLQNSASHMYHLELWLSWMDAQLALGKEVSEEIWSARKRDVDRLAASIRVQVKWLQLQAKRAEEPSVWLQSAYKLLVKGKGQASIDTLEAKAAWLEFEDRQERFVMELPSICERVKFALEERLGVLPSDRQLVVMRRLVGVHERVLLRALRNSKGVDLKELLALTYSLKNVNMRIHRITALLLREDKQTEVLEKFALLSQQIVEVPVLSESDRERKKQWVIERDRLAISMKGYRDAAMDEFRKFVVPDLPLEKTYVEWVTTENDVFRWMKTDDGWFLESLGKMVAWEKKLTLFRRKLMRGQGDFESLAEEIFSGVPSTLPVRLAPDGLFFSLPWFELAKAAGFSNVEIWPNLCFYKEGREKYRVYRGNGIFVSEFQGKASLPWVQEEEFSCWLDGMEVMDQEIDEVPLLDMPDLLHFSGHGQINKPIAEGILRNPFVEAQLCMPDNKVVTALDLAIRDWSWTRFVYVNACESFAGEYVPMEGVVGISYALFLGGANSILLTLYPVQDEVAAQFSLGFYRNLHKMKSRYQAFAQTKTDLADRYSMKSLAAFQLLGSGADLVETFPSRLVRLGRRWMRRHNQNDENESSRK